MNFFENIRVALGAIRENLLRTILTALIIAFGIMSLVGILTAVDSIQASVSTSFASLGANAFDIYAPNARNRRQQDNDANVPPIKYKEATKLKIKSLAQHCELLEKAIATHDSMRQSSRHHLGVWEVQIPLMLI